MAFQWSLAALETLMAEDQMDQHAAVLRAFSVVALWRLRRVCRAFHRWGTAALAALLVLLLVAPRATLRAAPVAPRATLAAPRAALAAPRAAPVARAAPGALAALAARVRAWRLGVSRSRSCARWTRRSAPAA